MQKIISPPLPSNTVFYEVIKKPVRVLVAFANEKGRLKTLEGDVDYEKGAALLTGQHGDVWPVERDIFNATYMAVDDTAFGEDGTYQKRAIKVLAMQLSQATSVEVGYASNLIKGSAGDWLVQYSKDDYGIVRANIFEATYEILNRK